MNKYNKSIVTTLLSISGLYFAASEFAYSGQVIRKTREKAIVFTEVIPSEGDITRIDHERRLKDKAALMSKPKRVYVVKIYAELPKTAMAAELYIDNLRIEEYHFFKEGVFFKIYGDDNLERYYDKPIRFIFNKTEYDLDISFPAERETLHFRQNSAQTKKLPTLKELLDEQAEPD